MAATFVDYNGNQGTGTNNADFGFTFPSFKKQDVKVEVDNVVKTLDTDYQINTYNVVSGGTVTFIANIPSLATQKIRIFRETDVATDSGNYDPKAVFQAGSSIKADDLNNNFKQALFAAKEQQEQTIQTHEIKDAAVTTDKIKDLNVTTAKIADSNVTTAKIADSNITTAKIADNAVTTAKIPDDAITGPKLGTDSIDGHNIQDDSINSEHYVDLSIDTQHVANENITTAKLANDAVTSSKLADNAVLTDNVTDANITTAKIADDAVTDAKIADGTLDGRYYTETELDAGQLDNRYFTETELTNGSLDGRYFTETELTNGALDGRYFTETEADARYFNISTGDTIKDGDTFPDNDTTIATTAAINDRIIDLVDDVGGFVPIANETSFPTANPDVNNGAGTIVSVKAASTGLTAQSGTTLTIANGAGTGNTVTITGLSVTIPSGFGFLVETTTTLHTYTFHRLVPKATEVETVANISSNITTVANNTSNINAVAADASDIGIVAADGTDIGLVAGSISNVNTAAGSITNVNTTAGSIANVNTVAGAIANVNTTATNISSVNNVSSNISSVNSFGDLYQIASSNPSTDGGGNAVAEGDLYFNTTANRLKVYDGANWVDGVAAASGGGVQTTGATFTGDVKLNDNVKLLVGTGNDLEIFHDGTHSRIKDVGTGNLFISGTNTQFINAAGSETIAKFTEDGPVELYFNGTKKLETTNTGLDVTGNIVVSGNVDGRDVAADGTKLDGIEASATADQTASEIVSLLSDQDISTTGRVLIGTTVEGEVNADDLTIATSGNTGITIRSGNTHNGVIQFSDTTSGTGEYSGYIDYDHNINLLKFGTSSLLRFQIDSSGNVQIPNDSGKLELGASQDLEIYHDGTNSYLDNATGIAFLRNTGTNGSQIQLLNNNSGIKIQGKIGEQSIIVLPNGAVELYHDNTKRFETVSDGAHMTRELRIVGTSVNDVESGRVRLTEDGEDMLGGYVHYNGSTNILKIGVHPSSDTTVSNDVDCIEMNRTSGSENVELNFSGTKKFETTSAGGSVSGDLGIGVTTASGGYSRNLHVHGPGNGSVLKLTDNNTGSGNDDGMDVIQYQENGYMYLRENGNIFFGTNNTGRLTLASNGNLRPFANSTYDLGESSYRWATIYGSAVNLNSDIRFASASWTGESCKIQQHSGSLYIQGGGSNTTHNIILRAGSAGTDRVYMADSGNFFPAGNNTQNLGLASNQWATIYGTSLDLGGPVLSDNNAALKINNTNGYIQVGSLNSSYAHFYTDLPQYFFSDPIEVNGNVKPYSNNVRTLGDNSHRWSTVHATNYEVYGSIQNVGIGKGVAILRERESENVRGGTFSSGADRIRELNVHETQGISGLESFCTLDTTNHYFTLEAGTYMVYFTAMAFDVNSHRAKIITYNGTDVIFGNNARTGSGDSTATHTMGWGYISTASTQSYYLVHRAQTSRTDLGFGYDNDISGENEYYAQVIIFRIS